MNEQSDLQRCPECKHIINLINGECQHFNGREMAICGHRCAFPVSTTEAAVVDGCAKCGLLYKHSMTCPFGNGNYNSAPVLDSEREGQACKMDVLGNFWTVCRASADGPCMCNVVVKAGQPEMCQFNKGHSGPCTWLRPVAPNFDTSSWCGKPIGVSEVKDKTSRRDVSRPHKFEPFVSLPTLCRVYDSVRADSCSLPASDEIHKTSVSAGKDLTTQPTECPRPAMGSLPWEQGILADWDIVGMNHYHKDHERWLFVAMTNGFHCIRAESTDADALFAVLAMAAQVHAANSIQPA